MSAPAPQSPVLRLLSTLPVFLLLSLTVLQWVSGQLSGRLIRIGEDLWPGYTLQVRREGLTEALPAEPRPAAAASAEAGGADQALINDLLVEAGSPAAPAEAGGADQALINDLLQEAEKQAAAPAEASSTPPSPPPVEAPAPNEAPAPSGAPVAPPEAAAPAAGGSADQDLINDLLKEAGGPAPTAPAAPAAELPPPPSPMEITGSMKAFRALDRGVEAFAAWGAGLFRPALVLLIALAAATATWARGHIALSNARGPLDDRISQGLQLLGNLLVAASCLQQHMLDQASGTDLANPELPLMWATAFVAMSGLNLAHLLRPLPAEGGAQGTLLNGLLSTPLYTTMALICSAWFLLGEQYLAGIAVYLFKLTEHAQLYIFVGLYVWAGMLLKRTSVVPLTFDLLRPWKLSPEMLAIIAVLGASLPTAYSGASGIFVIAAGGLIFQELMAAGARRGLAIASTAMSGSLGVVLRPCLLPVIVAYLNPVTTDVLYGWGLGVFALTAVTFAAVVLLTGSNVFRMAPAGEALSGTLTGLRPLLRPLLAAAGVVAACYFLLGSGLDEHTAPTILPMVMALILLLERGQGPARGVVAEEATAETGVHIGALLQLMALSIAFGGVFERSEVMNVFPADLGSPWLAMALLVAMMVVVGMLMDPYGAVILVSATISSVAYTNGIHPAHFWLMVLTAFELGYLSPPVALNQLLTRQVIGGEAYDPPGEGGLWRRHEKILLPVTVMGIALLVVAFVPLFFYDPLPKP